MLRVVRLLCFFLFSLQLSACVASRSDIRPVSAPEATVQQSQTSIRSPAVNSVIVTARKMLGAPYRYGGANPHGFDCSGLVSYAYQRAGIQVPRTSSEQFRQSSRVPLQRLQAGDLLFFRLSPPKVSHVAIYDRDGRFIHAPSSGKRVAYASLDNPYWRKHLVAAGRF